jgi:hypothetical protein
MSGKLVVYPIAAGPTPATRLTNWGIVSPLAEPDSRPPRREDWSRLAHRSDVVTHVTRFTNDLIDVTGLVAATGGDPRVPVVRPRPARPVEPPACHTAR